MLRMLSVSVPLTLGLVGLAAALPGCTTPVVEGQLDAGQQVLEGKIVNIVQVDEGAGLGEEVLGSLVGATVGSAIGGGTGKTIAVGVGAVAGAKGADMIAGKTAHRLTIRTSSGAEYDCVVHGNGFMMDDEVDFTVKDGKVTSIAEKVLIDSRKDH